MKFFCNCCETEKDFAEYSILVIEKWGHGIKRFCRSCRSPQAGVADVFWDGKPEENLANDPLTDKPRVFFSKGEKAAYLKSRGIMEAGDRVHGAPVQVHQNQNKKVDSKPMVQAALREVMKMSPSRRHQEYLKIVKQGERNGTR